MVIGAGAEDVVVIQRRALAGGVDGLVIVEVEQEVIVRSMGHSASHLGGACAWGKGFAGL